MCEFCIKHGEGEKWYLQAKNYAEDLLSDMKRRRMIEGFSKMDIGTIREKIGQLDRLHRMPAFVRRVITRRITKKMKKQHFGQVVPIEEIERILGFVNSIVRVGCICRKIGTGKEQRFCYGVSMGPNGGEFAKLFKEISPDFLSGPDALSTESLTKEEALSAMREHEKEGLCHTVWTFRTPFIGGICNCDRADCLALKTTLTHGITTLFRGEYVAEVDPEACVGCRACMRVCQFGAMAYSAGEKKTVVDRRHCYGCGICRSVCPKNAIVLHDRADTADVAEVW
ncbi:MAG: 4Fe-4S binding protein [Acidobacteria bacterium]|nr:4Fe-4S binding protein [Acidobacteriota bacterium]